jgi:hypothetical protein
MGIVRSVKSPNGSEVSEACRVDFLGRRVPVSSLLVGELIWDVVEWSYPGDGLGVARDRNLWNTRTKISA